ncbi:MAG TPA: DUF3857 and transglutaminase domain-containing protein, partial [Candidatus Methylacidiphilales bacterium]|nr:DUF3857 and transglutaminase domain-containing protein [Candidatus Methylacidiphilales bacterium]
FHPTLAAQPPAPFAGEPFTLTAAELQHASADIPPTKDNPAEILYEEGTYRIAPDGSMKYRHRLIYRVDAESAVQGWSEIRSEYDPWFENQAQLHARVLETNGSFVELDQKTVTDAPVKGDDSETFSSQHLRRAPLPGMSVGAIVEETESVDERIPYFSGGNLYRFSFRDNVPIGRSRLIVELPSAMPYKDDIQQLPGLSVTKTETAGTRRIVYEATNLPADHDSDINLDTNTPTTPIVEFATGASWGAIANAYSELADPQAVTADAEPILPPDLPADRMARIRAIVKQLHHQVRYTGVEFGAARLTPQRPSEVIQRHYGDCKDKANLLVTMLRAAGIQAHLALLSTGPGSDVDAAMPGINRFDHAIVYLPATGKGQDAMWIDATAEFFAVGTLPYEDQGRNALVISPTTTQLTRTPDPRPEDSILIENRTFKLAEFGPSHVEEISETHGTVDAVYRGDYGGPETPQIHENMENYVKNAYLAKSLTSLGHGDAADFDHPFNLTLVADQAKRGLTSLVDGIVVIFPSGTTNGLPKWFSTTPPVPGPDMSADTRHDLELAQKSRPPTFAVRPYIYEQRARILIPAGFSLRSLPPSKTT